MEFLKNKKTIVLAKAWFSKLQGLRQSTLAFQNQNISKIMVFFQPLQKYSASK